MNIVLGTLPEFVDFEHTEVRSLEEIQKTLEWFNVYLANSNFDLIGQEGFFNAITRMFAGLCNTFLHILNNAKTNIFRFYRTLKRTELVYYHEANLVSVKRILSRNYGEVNSLDVPIPNKMSGTYPQTIVALVDFLKALQMEVRFKAIVNFSENLRDKIISGVEFDVRAGMIPANDLVGISQKFKDYNKYLSDIKSIRTKRFSEVFPQETDLKFCDDTLYNVADFQYSVARIESAVNDVASNFQAIINAIQNKDIELSKQALTSLSDISMYYAKLFDMFGVAVQDLTRVEHNFVEVLKVIRKSYNL